MNKFTDSEKEELVIWKFNIPNEVFMEVLEATFDELESCMDITYTDLKIMKDYYDRHYL